MTATESLAQHPDPTTWTTADVESFEVLRLNDDHRAQTTRDSADRLRALLAPAA